MGEGPFKFGESIDKKLMQVLPKPSRGNFVVMLIAWSNGVTLVTVKRATKLLYNTRTKTAKVSHGQTVVEFTHVIPPFIMFRNWGKGDVPAGTTVILDNARGVMLELEEGAWNK